MRRIAIYILETGEIVRVIAGQTRSVNAAIQTIPDGQSFLLIPLDAVVKGMCVLSDELVPAPICKHRALKRVRIERSNRLANDCDPILNNALRRRALGPEKVRQWRKYRQALLDITKGDPLEPKWPEKPE